ncbi:MAG: hypothetical protein EA377_05090 [Phycisphaerales bacterium]|nr:MAG: hypothetical protein EA377_05090 [Phycisphaerales bacterium]
MKVTHCRHLLIGLLVTVALWPAAVMAQSGSTSADRRAEFKNEIDFTHLGRIAVHSDGRVKSYGSFARGMMQFVSGPHAARSFSPPFMYMDLMLRPRAYEDEPIIFVKNVQVRDQIIRALERSFESHVGGPSGIMGGGNNGGSHAMNSLTAERYSEVREQLERRLDRFLDEGLIAPAMLRDPFVDRTVDAMRQDLLRTARFVNELESALAVSDPGVLRSNLRLIPPPGGGFEDPWLTFEQLRASMDRDDHVLSGVEVELKNQLLDAWDGLQRAWQSMNAEGVNAHSKTLATLLPQVNPELYPGEGSRAGWPWSVKPVDAYADGVGAWAADDGWKWISSIGTTLFCGIFILMGISRNWPTMTSIGVALVASGIVFHVVTLALGTTNPLPLESWYFQVHNMTWVWIFYGLSLIPLMLALVFRWSGAQWIGMGMFLLAFGLHTAALFIRWYVSDRWPNSNMFEAVTTAAWFGGCTAILLELCVRRLPLRSVFAICSAAASMVALMCAYYMPIGLDPNIRNMMPVLHDLWLYIHTNVIILSYCLIFMAAVTGTLYLMFRFVRWFTDKPGINEYARMGGAASLIQTGPDGQPIITRAKSSIGQVLDGTTMILVELSFILLWAGTVMGAIWADHSWGRPWGWDPKEVFALNTFIVFVALIHARLKVRDKGLWTAIIALIGAAVMLFNWIAINYVITGLHSYA